MIRKLFPWLPAAGWYSVIWSFSAQTSAVSGDLSDRLLWRVLYALSASFRGAAVPVQDSAVELLSFFERKAAHMTLYCILFLLVWFAVSFLTNRFSRLAGSVSAICFALAALDEYHQTFVAGRSGELRDALVDLSGGLLALLALLLAEAAFRRRKPLLPLIWLLPSALFALLPLLHPDLITLPVFAWSARKYVLEPISLQALSPILCETMPPAAAVFAIAACGGTFFLLLCIILSKKFGSKPC